MSLSATLLSAISVEVSFGMLRNIPLHKYNLFGATRTVCHLTQSHIWLPHLSYSPPTRQSRNELRFSSMAADHLAGTPIQLGPRYAIKCAPVGPLLDRSVWQLHGVGVPVCE